MKKLLQIGLKWTASPRVNVALSTKCFKIYQQTILNAVEVISILHYRYEVILNEIYISKYEMEQYCCKLLLFVLLLLFTF